MHGVPDLKHLKESCDNFASCLDPTFGTNNRDVRANDSVPFMCSLYSFCPDPCCPRKHLTDSVQCWDSPENPCFEANPSGQRECAVVRRENTEFGDIVLNRWNVTCRCALAGTVWDSRFGICIDIDECLAEVHDCDPLREACVNTFGGHQCACRWGYTWRNGRCEENPALTLIKLKENEEKEENQKKLATSIVKKLFNYIFRTSDASRAKKDLFLLCAFWLILPAFA